MPNVFDRSQSKSGEKNMRLSIRCHRPLRLAILMALAAVLTAAQHAAAVPSPDFYTNVPANLASLAPGALIKSEPESDFLPTLSHQSAAYRIMYRSTGQLGGPVAVTGMVFVPQGTAPSGGWPVVAWPQ